MPSIKTITPILGGRFYHIFNRGINRADIFFEPKNYDYFLSLVNRFLIGYVDILAYCLLPNHFHFVVKVKDELVLARKENHSMPDSKIIEKDILGKRTIPSRLNSEGRVVLVETNEEEIGKIVSHQLKRLFITYAMAINKQEKRVGSLFTPKYKRLEITTQDYLEYAIFYTHFNSEKHGIIYDFRQYKFSSYKAISSNNKTKVEKNFVLEIFGGKEEFLNYHTVFHEEKEAVVVE